MVCVLKKRFIVYNTLVVLACIKKCIVSFLGKFTYLVLAFFSRVFI